MEIRPELVQDSRECWVTRNNGEIDQVPMGSEADRAWSRPEDLLVPREAPAFVLRCLMCAKQRCCYKMVSGLPGEGMQDCGPRCATQSPPVQAALDIATACCGSADRNGEGEQLGVRARAAARR